MFLEDPSHTTRHADPNRTVRGVEVTQSQKPLGLGSERLFGWFVFGRGFS